MMQVRNKFDKSFTYIFQKNLVNIRPQKLKKNS